MNLAESLILIFGGLLAGALNTLASSGSAVTLPLLVFLGIPPTIANGTNRLNVFAGALVSMFTFHRRGAIAWRHALRLAIPTVIGTGVGTGIATVMSTRVMGWAITIAVILALIMILTRSKQLLASETQRLNPLDRRQVLVFFFVGIWTGFIVLDSATYMLLSLVLMVGYDLTKANAIKSVLLFLTSVLSLLIFSFSAEVNWTAAGLLASGSIVGSWGAARIALQPWAKVWVYRLLVIIVVVELIQLVWRSLS